MTGIGWRGLFVPMGRHVMPVVIASGRLPPPPLDALGWWVPFIKPGQWAPSYWSWDSGLPGELGEVEHNVRLAMTALALRDAQAAEGVPK